MLGFITAMFIMCMGDPRFFEDGDTKSVIGKGFIVIFLTVLFNTILF